jgi:hypothetical protein
MIPERPKLETQRYLQEAVAAIDEEFGEGYAAANPGLVGAFIQAATLEESAKYHGWVLETVGEEIEGAAKAIYHIGEQMDLMGLKDIAKAVNEAASSIGDVSISLDNMPAQYGGLEKIAEAITNGGSER